MDNKTPKQRSYNMSRVKGKNTRPEMLVRRFLHSRGFRYRLHVNTLPGKPDIVLPRYRTIIFVHGCFWHGHPKCKRAKLPATRVEFWSLKIKRNVKRDKQYIPNLQELGYRCLVLWECKLKEQYYLESTVIPFLQEYDGNINGNKR